MPGEPTAGVWRRCAARTRVTKLITAHARAGGKVEEGSGGVLFRTSDPCFCTSDHLCE
ncbi:hypothetical protein GCM10010206_71120 [Streptomyces cinerochromogenes]|nr:hypothetical protein GCM10010206_71120 [Streptomyces cinerochromogenes]